MKPVISLTVEVHQINLTIFRDNAAIFILSVSAIAPNGTLLLPYFNVINTFPRFVH